MEQSMKRRMAIAMMMAAPLAEAVTVRDDAGKTVTLDKPAMRVISMAPHVTETLFVAGGGSRIVGTVNYSDYPEAAKSIPRIGSNREIDLERVISMKPDLIVAWMHNNAERQIEMVRQLGVPVYQSDPQTLDGIAENVVRLGQLMGTETVANPAAAELRKQLAGLRSRYAGRPRDGHPGNRLRPGHRLRVRGADEPSGNGHAVQLPSG